MRTFLLRAVPGTHVQGKRPEPRLSHLPESSPVQVALRNTNPHQELRPPPASRGQTDHQAQRQPQAQSLPPRPRGAPLRPPRGVKGLRDRVPSAKIQLEMPQTPEPSCSYSQWQHT